jgi:hypothetical protein
VAADWAGSVGRLPAGGLVPTGEPARGLSPVFLGPTDRWADGAGSVQVESQAPAAGISGSKPMPAFPLPAGDGNGGRLGGRSGVAVGQGKNGQADVLRQLRPSVHTPGQVRSKSARSVQPVGNRNRCSPGARWGISTCNTAISDSGSACLASNPSSPAFLKSYQPRKDKSGKLLATFWQHLPGDIGLALRFKTGNLLHAVLVSLEGRSVASTCATNLCSNADRSSCARPDTIADVPNSAAIERPMRHNGASRCQRGLMLGACFLALQVQVDVAEGSGKRVRA